MVKLANPNAYNQEIETGVGKNSLVIESNEFITKATGVIDKAEAGETLIGLSQTKQTFASDNQTVALDTVNYNPFYTNTKYELAVAGQTITFDADLVTGNTIDLNVNGVAMTQVAFNTDNATTLGDIATQLTTDFPTLIGAAAGVGASDQVTLTPVTTNSSVTITGITVAGGASQATGTVANDTLAYTDEGKYYDITTTGQTLNYHSAHASSGQVVLYRSVEDGTFGLVKIANT